MFSVLLNFGASQAINDSVSTEDQGLSTAGHYTLSFQAMMEVHSFLLEGDF